jgi:hypothetical protein
MADQSVLVGSADEVHDPDHFYYRYYRCRGPSWLTEVTCTIIKLSIATGSLDVLLVVVELLSVHHFLKGGEHKTENHSTVMSFSFFSSVWPNVFEHHEHHTHQCLISSTKEIDGIFGLKQFFQ